MIYELPLEQCFLHPADDSLQKAKRNQDFLKNHGGLAERLTFYNENVCSLAKLSVENRIRMRVGTPRDEVEIYSGRKNCQKSAKDLLQNTRIFLTVRQNEVQRIISGVNRARDYREKLRFLFKTKGFVPDQTPRIYPNYDLEKNSVKDLDDLEDMKPLIDLVPTSDEERAIYNDFVREEFDRNYRTERGFSEKYKNFDFENERKRLDMALRNAIDPQRLIEYLIKRIEKRFNYPEEIHAEGMKNHIQKKVEARLQEDGVIISGFTKMVLGVPIDLDKHLLNSFSYAQFIHVSEIVKFYRYLKELSSKGIDTTQESTKPKSATENINEKLQQYGFFDLEAVKRLSLAGRQSLVSLISSNSLPYQIAMFEHAGFINHLLTEHFLVKYKMHFEISKWLGVDSRAVKGNISSMQKNTTENKKRYTAHHYKETVEKDYQNLK